jgi:hypothetical protein
MEQKMEMAQRTQKIMIPLATLLTLVFCMLGCQADDSHLEGLIEDETEEEITFNINPNQTLDREIITCPENSEYLAADLEILNPKPGMEPEPRIPFLDPVFGTCVVRVTDRNSDLSGDDPSSGLKNEYSRVQSFNADGSLILVRGTESTWYIYDANTLLPLGEVPLGVEPRWDTDDPYRIFFYEDTSLFSYDLLEGKREIRHDFSKDFPEIKLNAAWTRYEGSPSEEGSIFGLMVQDEDWEVVGFAIYDLNQDQVIARRNFPGGVEVDSVTISPSGEFFLAFFDTYCTEGQLGTEDSPCGLMVYDQNLSNGRGLLRIVGHADVAYSKVGQEVLVYQDIDTDHISIVDLSSGKITPLFPIDFSHGSIGLHFSGRGFEFPGWAIVSTYTRTANAKTWMDDQVFAIELKPSGLIIRLAHTHSLVDENQDHDYWAEPHASVNQSFTRVLFTSNWGRSGTGEVEMYLIVLPEDWVKLFIEP